MKRSNNEIKCYLDERSFTWKRTSIEWNYSIFGKENWKEHS